MESSSANFIEELYKLIHLNINALPISEKKQNLSIPSQDSETNEISSTKNTKQNSEKEMDIMYEESITGLKESEEKQLSERDREIMKKIFDKDYFGSYEKISIHFRMIRDKVRTDAYRDALKSHADFLNNKVVLDVGCGTGILSLFSAECNAKEVYAVERSDFVKYTYQIAKQSNWYHRIRIIQGAIEEIELPYYRTKVDVIVSEWMGYCLLYESMLTSVLFARDKWLRPGGLMFPEKCGLYVFANEDMDFCDWKFESFNKKIGGIDVSCFRKVSLGIPVIKTVHAPQVVTNSVPLIEYDLYTMKNEDINFEAEFTLTANRTDFISAISTYFNVLFPPSEKTVCISTSPLLPVTHWKQTCFFLNGIIPIHRGENITGTFKAMQNSKNKRRIDFLITVHYEGKSGSFHQRNEYSLI